MPSIYMKIKPYIIVPNLIKQPTWGGSYILEYKNITNPVLLSQKIGQSYEIYESSSLSQKVSTKNNPSIQLSDPNNPENTQDFYQDDLPFLIGDLIKISPQEVLGRKYVSVHGEKMSTLIKVNQGKGNSYQIHVSKPSGKWLPKPESWFFFENGLVTLGAKKGIDWEKYHQVCQKIDELAKSLGDQVKQDKIEFEDARSQLKTFIEDNNPEQFVNLLEIKKDQAIDLSKMGGIHHSWEEDDTICPRGNVIYEVQQNVYDSTSTIRSFDKGKIKNHGNTRDLQIDDYFKYVNHSPEANDPSNHIIHNMENVRSGNNYSVDQVFLSDKYAMQKINFKRSYQDETTESFHHLFAKDGDFTLIYEDTKLTITRGYSVFIPAITGHYRLESTSDQNTVLKTYF